MLRQRVLVAALAATGLLAPTAAAHTTHTVAPGETLSGIAAAKGVSLAALAAANGVSPDAFAIAGTSLSVPDAGAAPAAAQAAPVTSSPVPAAPGRSHAVAPGETLSGIAAAAGVPLSALAAANGLSTTSFAIAGSTLRIPAAGSTPAGTTTSGTTASSGPLGAYRVRVGDTLSAIAARHGIPLGTLAANNGLSATGTLMAGTSLRLDGSGSAAPAAAAPTSGGPSPTPGRTTASEVSSIAAQHGVPGSLAAAIAWQESGFNNSMVSVANARGVMQILPSTWDWIGSSLGAGKLDPNSVQDNVRAGSLFLRQLLKESGGDPALAAAGYYQGMASVRRIGMLPETRKYVANVLALRSRFGG